MHDSSSGAGREIAQWLLPVFVARFIANGNRYDPDPNTRTRFTEEDIDELTHKYAVDSEQCNRFAKKAYLNHKGEKAFRSYIGVPEPGNDVRHFSSSIHEFMLQNMLRPRCPTCCPTHHTAPATCCHFFVKTCIFDNLVVT